ncbi:MAG TPA: GTPase ObgE [Planctomycetota bacterium]|jgi:GTP-binding protein|nr:GTPase ObgE [Planctomycetota bacterium]
MFRDEAKLKIKAGDGGNGCVSFRREALVPRGGPDGGDGGKGGDVVLVADGNYNTLYHLIHRPRFVAPSGGHGGGQKCSGKMGRDLVVLVPVGTLVRDLDKNVLLKDLAHSGDRIVICKGGRGGRGNQHFATSTNQAPRKAIPGGIGESRNVRLELKMIADVGLVGLPNAGKSTLISRLSAARPKVADYPFTTLVPNLGIIRGKDYRDIVVADLPGIIEGAHEGKGLGDRFLKHVERTRLIVHLVDVSPEALKPPLEAYRTIRKELESYSPVLSAKPEIIVATKIDATGAKKSAGAFKKKVKHVLEISSVTGAGLKELIRELFRATAPGDGVE